MTDKHTHTAPRHIRREIGRLYEDFNVGDVYEHIPGRTISEADNTWFTLLTMNQHPLHFDAVYAAGTEFGRPVVNSALTLSIVTGMSVADVSGRAIANLGWTGIRLPAPVFVGDTLYAQSEVLTKRESKSRPEAGIVTVRTTGAKANAGRSAADTSRDIVVISFERTILVPKAQAGK